MSTGTIIALAIVAVSLLMIIAVAAITYKKVKPTLDNIKETNEVVTQRIDYFTREGNHLTEQINLLSKRIELLQEVVEEKVAGFQDLSNENGKFQTSLRYLQSHASDYASGISSNVKDEIQEDGPKIWETFKRAVKKTAQKQKVRYQK